MHHIVDFMPTTLHLAASSRSAAGSRSAEDNRRGKRPPKKSVDRAAVAVGTAADLRATVLFAAVGVAWSEEEEGEVGAGVRTERQACPFHNRQSC